MKIRDLVALLLYLFTSNVQSMDCFTKTFLNTEKSIHDNQYNSFSLLPVEIQHTIGLESYLQEFKHQNSKFYVDNEVGYIRKKNYSLLESLIPLYYTALSFSFQSDPPYKTTKNYMDGLDILHKFSTVSVNSNNAIVEVQEICVLEENWAICTTYTNKNPNRYLSIKSTQPVNQPALTIDYNGKLNAIGCSHNNKWIIYQQENSLIKLFCFNRKNTWTLAGETTVSKQLKHLRIIEKHNLILYEDEHGNCGYYTLAQLFPKRFHQKKITNFLQEFCKERGINKTIPNCATKTVNQIEQGAPLPLRASPHSLHL